jgi:hypothetical protein
MFLQNKKSYLAIGAVAVVLLAGVLFYYKNFEQINNAEFVSVVKAAPVMITTSSRVSLETDDAEEYTSNGFMDVDSSTDLEFVFDGVNQEVGMRFQNILIPIGATILNAYIEFETDETGSAVTNLSFYGEATDNSATFTSTAYNISNRTKTSSSVNWNNVPDWDSVSEKHRTPDISTLIQEIVNRGGWISGNALSIIVTGSGKRTAESYDGEPANAPLLTVSYERNLAPAEECKLYAVHDESDDDSQFITIDIATGTVSLLGLQYDNYDIEGLDIDSTSGIIYVGAHEEGNFSGDIFTVDALTGDLELVGNIGVPDYGINGLAFRPGGVPGVDLWGWVSDEDNVGLGLYTIDKNTGIATLVKSSNIEVQGLAWNNDGTLLYASSINNLYEYEPISNTLNSIANNLPGDVEALEMRLDGYLVGAIHNGGPVSIFIYDPIAKSIVASDDITTIYDDIEGIAWPESCPVSAPGFVPVTANVMGFAWSENIGWISFNNRNCDTNNDGYSEGVTVDSGICPVAGSFIQGYGVNVDLNPGPTYGQLSGYAWSENIGWIKFDPVGLYPACPGTTCPVNPNYFAKYTPATKKITGWARACAGTVNGDCNNATRTDGWDGWILMGPVDKGTGDNGTWIDNSLSPNEFKNWAWGGDIVGWVSLNHLTGGSAIEYKVYLSAPLNTPPVVSDLAVEYDYCVNDLNSIKFIWIFSDLEDDANLPFPISQSAYQIDLTRVEDLAPCTISENNDNFFITKTKIDTYCGAGFIDYKYDYTWEITVQDSAGLNSATVSSASEALSPLETPDHQYPIANFSYSTPDFSYIPGLSVLQFQTVSFDPLTFPYNSICYNDFYASVPCQKFEWDFDNNIIGFNADETYLFPSAPNTTNVFSEIRSYKVDLRVTDDDNYSCRAYKQGNAKDIPVNPNKPTWNEVEP